MTVTPPSQLAHETVPVPGAEAVVTPTLTPTQTPTPSPSPTPTEAPPSEPQDVVFKAADGQELVGTYYPPPVCPSPLTLVYFPWVRGDKDDFEELAALLPPDLAYGAFAVTPRGCEGGCAGWDVDGWLLDYAAALEYAAQELPCAGQGPLVAVGPSVGGDGAIYACAQEERCEGALAISAGGYLDVPFEEEVRAMVEQGKHVWSVSAEGDSEAATWPWRPDFDYSYCRQIIFPGAEHGNQLFNSGTGRMTNIPPAILR